MSKPKTNRRPKPTTDTGKITSRDDLAKVYGVSRTGADRWLLRPDVPKGPPWNCAEFDAFLESFGSPFAPSRAAVRKAKRATGNGNAGSDYRRKIAAEAACKEADAEKKRLDLRMRKSELVERAAVKAVARKIVITVKNRLENIPDEMSMLLPPDIRPQATHDLRESIRLILTELAEMKHVDKAND